MTAQEIWDVYSARNNVDADWDSWAFGDDCDLLAQLVLSGRKTATSSALDLYQLEDEPLPQEGAYSVILDGREEAVCIIRTTKVFVIPYREVGETHAYKEGEGDRSLSYWKCVHERFFRQELEQAGMTFSENMKVVCEEFIRVFP